MLQISQPKITRNDVLLDLLQEKDEMLVLWVRQEIKARHLLKCEGKALAVREFGGGHPCSTSTIEKMEALHEFRNYKMDRTRNSKSQKVSVDPVHELMISVGRDY